MENASEILKQVDSLISNRFAEFSKRSNENKTKIQQKLKNASKQGINARIIDKVKDLESQVNQFKEKFGKKSPEELAVILANPNN